MTFKVRNTEANLRNAELETVNGNLTYELSKSGRMIIINANESCFPYLTTAKQFRKALSF